VTAPWLSIIGIGENGLTGLGPAARSLLDSAEIIVGGERHLAMLGENKAQHHAWTRPFSDNIAQLKLWRGRPVAVLASGDPMWFGVGATLAKQFEPAEMTVLPHPGAFSLAAAKLGWPLQDVLCLTVHGRPIEPLALNLYPGARWLVLSEDGGTPATLAAFLSERGWGSARLTVLEHLGGAEKIIAGTAQSWSQPRAADLNCIAVELTQGPVLSRMPGLPDEAFQHDGQLTKRELRAATLSALAPWPGARLWDVGAGCGSIAIEWARAGGIATAIEQNAERRASIIHNAAALGVPQVAVLAGEAPAVLSQLTDTPDAIFVGGGTSVPGMMEACWSALKPGGRLVANAVTAEGEALLLDWQSRMGGELCRIAVSRLAPVGRFHTWHPLMPVTQYCGVKS